MIGVFDSGLGGMTVLQELVRAHPQRRFIYLGDQANAPYGRQRPDRVVRLTEQGIERLFRLGCQIVILACNTASTVALRPLQENWLPRHWPQRRVLGIVVPTIEALIGRSWHAPSPGADAARSRTVGIFATQATVDSAYFAVEIERRDPSLQIVQQACPELAGLIEQGADAATVTAEIERAVAAMRVRLAGQNLDSVLLGCTHYALVQDLFMQALGAPCELVSQPKETAAALARYLDKHPEFRLQPAAAPLLLTTGDAAQVSERAGRFLGRSVRFEHHAAAPPSDV